MVTIYGLKCRPNGMMYVGCTKGSLAKRAREHRCLLRQNKHREVLLQGDWNRYTGHCFEMLPLEFLEDGCTVQEKREAEMRWMKKVGDEGKLYNLNRTSFRPTDAAIAKGLPRAKATEGKKRGAEANEKRRLAQLGKPKWHGAKISATKQAKKQQAMR